MQVGKMRKRFAERAGEWRSTVLLEARKKGPVSYAPERAHTVQATCAVAVAVRRAAIALLPL